MARVDRMGIIREDSDTTTDTERYGNLYPVVKRVSHVNDYGGSDTDDVPLLDNITDCTTGSTCLFSNGDLYRLELSGWAKFGGTAGNRSVTTSRSVIDTLTDFTDTDGGEMR